MVNVIIRHPKKGRRNIGDIFCGTDMWGRGEGVQDSKLTIEILFSEAKARKKPQFFIFFQLREF